MVNITRQLKTLQGTVDGIVTGQIPLPNAMGPGRINTNNVKSKTIRSNLIDVSNLQAVSTKTGSLTVTGGIDVGTGGHIRGGKTAYSDDVNAGFWLGKDADTFFKFKVGDGTNYLRWTGSALEIKGNITASTGTIGGWTIGTQDLTADAGAVGLASAGTYRIWVGDATPANAEFSVTNAGALKTVSGTIGGWTIDTLGIRQGAGASERGIDGGSNAFYAGGTPAGANFRVTTAGNLFCNTVDINGGTLDIGANFGVNSSGVLTASGATINGALTATSLSITGTASFSGGSMTLPGGGSLTSASLDVNTGNFGGITVDGDATLGTGGRLLTSGAVYGSSGIFISYNAGSPQFSLGSGLTYSGGALTVGSATLGTGVTLTSAGVIRAGASDYSTGTGWILDYNAATPRFRVGTATSGANYLAFDGTNIEMRGKLKWGSTGQHYVDSSIMHLDAGSSESYVMEFRSGTTTEHGQIGGWSGTSSGRIYLKGIGTTNRYAHVLVGGSSTDSGTTVTLTARNSSVQDTKVTVAGDGIIQFDATGSIVGFFTITNRSFHSYGRIHPGSGSAYQSTGYFAWDGANVQVTGADFYITNYLKVAQSGAITNVTPGPCDEWIAIKDSGAIYKVYPRLYNNRFI